VTVLEFVDESGERVLAGLAVIGKQNGLELSALELRMRQADGNSHRQINNKSK
jgi:hypothetical protein